LKTLINHLNILLRIGEIIPKPRKQGRRKSKEPMEQITIKMILNIILELFIATFSDDFNAKWINNI